LGGRFGIALGHFGTALGTPWGPLRVTSAFTLGSCWGHFGVVLGSCLGHVEPRQVSLGAVWWSFWGPVGVTYWSSGGLRFAIAIEQTNLGPPQLARSKSVDFERHPYVPPSLALAVMSPLRTAPRAPFWGPCGITLGSPWIHLGVTLGPLWGHLGVGVT